MQSSISFAQGSAQMPAVSCAPKSVRPSQSEVNSVRSHAPSPGAASAPLAACAASAQLLLALRIAAISPASTRLATCGSSAHAIIARVQGAAQRAAKSVSEGITP